MGDQYLVDVARSPSMDDNPHRIIENYDVILAHWYDQYHDKLTELAIDLRRACTAFFTQFSDKQMWFDYRPGTDMSELISNIKTANRISEQIVNETKEFIQGVDRSACVCRLTSHYTRVVRQQTDREGTHYNRPQELWKMTRLLITEEFDNAFAEILGGDPTAGTFDFDLIDGTLDEAAEQADNILSLMLRVKEAHATNCLLLAL